MLLFYLKETVYYRGEGVRKYLKIFKRIIKIYNDVKKIMFYVLKVYKVYFEGKDKSIHPQCAMKEN